MLEVRIGDLECVVDREAGDLPRERVPFEVLESVIEGGQNWIIVDEKRKGQAPRLDRRKPERNEVRLRHAARRITQDRAACSSSPRSESSMHYCRSASEAATYVTIHNVSTYRCGLRLRQPCSFTQPSMTARMLVLNLENPLDVQA